MKINTFIQQMLQSKQTGIDSGVKPTSTDALTQKPTSEFSAVNDIFKKHGIEPDAETIKAVDAFMNTADGTELSKLEAVEMAIIKDMPLDEDHLIPIHEAIKYSTKGLEALLKVPVLPEVTLPQVLPYLKISTEDLKRVMESIEEDPEQSIAELVKEAFQQMETAPKHVVLQATTDVVNDYHINAFVEEGKELDLPAERNVVEVSEGVDESDDDLDQAIARAVEDVVKHMDTLIQTLEPFMHIKVFLIEETTQATRAAKTEFDQFQKMATEALSPPDRDVPEAQVIEKVVEALDKLILKSNVTLFTDMRMERDLLKASSLLDKAKELVNAGDLTGAKTIVSQVKETIEKISFKPSVQRVQAFVSHRTEQVEGMLKPKAHVPLEEPLKQALELFRTPEGSRQSKDVYEILRYMGLNHEPEVAELMESKQPQKNNDWLQSNVKEMLLKLMKEDVEHRAVESSTLNLTGQQMMSQPDQQDKRRFHCFNIPVKEDEALGNMKLYLTSRQKEGKIDYNNTQMYFSLELKHAGTVGIKVSVTSGVLDLKVISDKELQGFEAVLEGAEDIGFSKGTLTYESKGHVKGSDLHVVASKRTQVSKPSNTEKGFDFKI